MKKPKHCQHQLNSDFDVAKRLAFDFTHEQLLTAALIYIWNAETSELERLADEIINRMPPDFIDRYVAADIETYQDQLFLVADGCLDAAFRELCSRADHNRLRSMETYIQLLLEGPCKTEECLEDCNAC